MRFFVLNCFLLAVFAKNEKRTNYLDSLASQNPSSLQTQNFYYIKPLSPPAAASVNNPISLTSLSQTREAESYQVYKEVLPVQKTVFSSTIVPSTRRITTTKTTTPQNAAVRAESNREYNYSERSLLKGCFYNEHGYACCSKELQRKMEEVADKLLNNGTFHRCNVQKIANGLQDACESAFNHKFETVVGLSDFAQRLHFQKQFVCKIEVKGRYMLAYGTPEFPKEEARIRRESFDEIREYVY